MEKLPLLSNGGIALHASPTTLIVAAQLSTNICPISNLTDPPDSLKDQSFPKNPLIPAISFRRRKI
jgi:hypothetical protein